MGKITWRASVLRSLAYLVKQIDKKVYRYFDDISDHILGRPALLFTFARLVSRE